MANKDTLEAFQAYHKNGPGTAEDDEREFAKEVLVSINSNLYSWKCRFFCSNHNFEVTNWFINCVLITNRLDALLVALPAPLIQTTS